MAETDKDIRSEEAIHNAGVTVSEDSKEPLNTEEGSVDLSTEQGDNNDLS